MGEGQGMTFEVDQVERAREPLPTRALGEVVGVGERVLLGGDAAMRVIEAGPHPLMAAVAEAFASHRALVISPDAVWLTIAQGVAQHVRLNAEALRRRLVRHEGTRVIEVLVAEDPKDSEAWARAVDGLTGGLDEEVGPGIGRLLRCDFSTSTAIERTASAVILLATLAPYFEYRVTSICGIPEVTLLGTVDDWLAIRTRLDVIAELDLGWWTAALVPIANQLVRTAAGDVDVGFWQAIYKPKQAYGPELVTGWIGRLFPYVKAEGRYDQRNPMLAAEGAGIAADDVPAGTSSVVIALCGPGGGARGAVTIEAGLLGVEQDAAGRLVPRAGYVVRGGGTQMDAIAMRIAAEHATVPRGDGKLRPSGITELNALHDRFAEATLFAGPRAWRIRGAADVEYVEVVLGRGTMGVRRAIDLPDGGFLAAGPDGQVLLMRADAVKPGRKDPPDRDGITRIVQARTVERVEDIRVVGDRFAEVLQRALDDGPDVTLPAQATLLDVLPPHLRARHQPG